MRCASGNYRATPDFTDKITIITSRRMVRLRRKDYRCRCISNQSGPSILVRRNSCILPQRVLTFEDLTMHHTIEERHIFPVLAKRIPKFAHTAEAGHVDSHRAIHDGASAPVHA